MVRLIFCFSRRTGVSVSEFRDYWKSDGHKNNIKTLIGIFSPDRYADTLALHSTSVKDPHHTTWENSKGYDAIIEFFWNDQSILKERLLDQAVAKISKIIRGQSEKWIDNSRSAIFLTEEPEMVECSLPAQYYQQSG